MALITCERVFNIIDLSMGEGTMCGLFTLIALISALDQYIVL